METVWRWGLTCGCVIVLLDLMARLLSAGQPSTSQQLMAAETVDWLANLGIYSFCGFRVGNATRTIRSAAEASVIAGLVAGVAAVLVSQIVPPPIGDVDSPTAVLALNIAMGGVLGLVSGFFGMRIPQPKR